MAASIVHDGLTLAVAVASTELALYNRYSLTVAAVVGASVFIGGIYLSPDLDVVSRPYKRWGLLRWWWIGYRKWLGHRGWGHCPILGTVSRLVWTVPFWFPIIYYFRPPKIYLIVVLVGLEISALTHYLIDFFSMRRKK